MKGRTLIVVLAVGVAALIHFWPGEPAKPAETPSPMRVARPESVQRSGATVAAPPQSSAPASVNAQPRVTGPAPVSAIKIGVQAPSLVHAGDSFRVTVDLETKRNLRQIAFGVSYRQSVLQLVGTSPGTLALPGTGANFASQEPSDGAILVSLDLDSGVISGAGGLAVFEFQALKSGVSPLSIHSVTFVENDRQDSLTARTAYEGTVTVE